MKIYENKLKERKKERKEGRVSLEDIINRW